MYAICYELLSGLQFRQSTSGDKLELLPGFLLCMSEARGRITPEGQMQKTVCT